MKKFFLALAAVAAIAFVGCSKDDDDKKSDGLAGTTWSYTESEYGGWFTATLQFKSNGVVDWLWNGSEESGSETGTYTYDEPNVTMRMESGRYTGTVEGNTLRLHDEWGIVEIFTKK